MANLGYRAKRPIDFLVALSGLLVCFPILALIALAIRIDSPGPALFRQTRVGRNMSTFTCLKLRTMTVGTADAPTHEVRSDAVTRIGRLLRKSKIDELPQLINVIKGEMSLVGPRPCLPTQTELVAARRQLGIFRVRPGITGLAQIRGIDMSDPGALAVVDAEYCDKLSLLTDLNVIIQTAAGKGRQDKLGRAPDEQ